MTLLVATAMDRPQLLASLPPDRLVVLLLCAAWCDTCREFRVSAERLAKAHQDAVFVWLDIEDDEAIVGEVEVENFPTLAIARGETVLHFGVSLPHEAGVARLIEEMKSRDWPAAGIPAAVRAMVAALRAG